MPLILARERRQRLTVGLGVMRECPQSGRQLESSDSSARTPAAVSLPFTPSGFVHTEGDLDIDRGGKGRIDDDQMRLELGLESQVRAYGIRARWQLQRAPVGGSDRDALAAGGSIRSMRRPSKSLVCARLIN